jgi:signal transduction histidine kinase
MELKTKKWIYIFVAVAGLFLLLLGGWWSYLVIKLGKMIDLSVLGHNQVRLANMVMWEGLTFFALLFTFCLAILYIFLQDMRKFHAMQAYFASMTHELKTPLASIKLQSDFIRDLVDDDAPDLDQIKILLKRLNQDGRKLENQLDRTLQLARIERGGVLNLRSIELRYFLKSITAKYPELTIDLNFEDELEVMADDFSISLIFKNLIENTTIHNPTSKKIAIKAYKENNLIKISYDDNSSNFSGDVKRLGQLFYKSNSPKGTGIGLYLIKRLMKAMKGNIDFQLSDKLVFELTFLAK